jgi:C_GCAxxG_C_C family probable redox protein
MTPDKIEELENEAKKLFQNGYICAEAVSKVVLEELNFDTDKICGVATGFGGGIARKGQTCGALTGGIITIGAVVNNGFRKPDQKEIKDKVYQKVESLYNDFEKEFGSTICQNLTDCDFSTEEGMKKFSEENIGGKLCASLVGWTAKETFKLLEK